MAKDSFAAPRLQTAMLREMWIGVRRPLFFALFIGCTISFLTAKTLTLRLVLPSTLYWGFVPIIEVLAVTLVCWKERQVASLPEIIDSFFAGYTPWLVWLAGMSGIWAFLSPSTKPLDSSVGVIWQGAGMLIALSWSAYVDFRFFRAALKRNRGHAVRGLALHRLISWGLILPILGAPTIWSEITGRLW